VRTLCLLTKCPLPADNGSRQRLLHLMRALASLGPVDVAFDRPVSAAEQDAVREAFTGARVWAPSGPVRVHPAGRVRWLTRRRLPLRLALLDPRGVRRSVGAFIAGSPEPYDLVWSQTTVPSWLLGPALRTPPLIIDLADVQRIILDRPLQAARRAPDRWTVAGLKRRARLRTERDRWTRFERYEGSRAHVVTVCSSDDREAHGIPGAVVVPNGYERPDRPLGRIEVGEPPTVLLAGQLTYGPNVDGARWFVDEVLPGVRRRVPGATLALVGRTSAAVDDLAGRDGVDVRGYVEAIDDELGRADLVVVPLRQGSGTRIKILEAWAHHLPVVSTSVGAEGLGAHDERELLIADDAEAFAAAVDRLLTDRALRAQVTEAGAKRFDAEFDWALIEQQFADLARAVVASATRFDRVAPA